MLSLLMYAYAALPAGVGMFQVLIKDYEHIVDLTTKTCDCRRWKLTDIPCYHATGSRELLFAGCL